VIVDVTGAGYVPAETEPSVTRGANFVYEAMRVGPEEAGLHWLSVPVAERRQTLDDVAEFMRFTREIWNVFTQTHLGLVGQDTNASAESKD
jgi:hypothetical protein